MSSAPIPPPSAIQPGREYLIVCSSEQHRYAGHRCRTVCFIGNAQVYGPQGWYLVTDAWQVDIEGSPPAPTSLLCNFAYGCRAAWLVDADAGILDAIRAGDIIDEVQELTGVQG